MKDRACDACGPQVMHFGDELHHRTVPAEQQLRLPSHILKDRETLGAKASRSEQPSERPGALKTAGAGSYERSLEMDRDRYKTLYSSLLTVYEQSRSEAQVGEDLRSEVVALRLQLQEVNCAKEAVEGHMATLLRRPLPGARTMGGPDSKVAGCVVCLDSAANLVCLPCKHLALCSGCSLRTDVSTCPICRCLIDDRMEIFLP